MSNDNLDHDPYKQIKAQNKWYVADQFAIQLGTEGRRSLIEFRWRYFEKCILSFIQRRTEHDDAQISILDAGCGDGINLFGLGRIVDKFRLNTFLTGIDYNPIRVQRSNIFDYIDGVSQASLYALPFSNSSFDVILCNHVLEHLHDDQNALNELNRVLKDDGILILGVPNEGCMLAYIRNHFVQRSILRTTDHVNFYTMNQVKSMLGEAGFDVLDSETENFFFPHEWIHYSLIEFSWGRRLINTLKRIFTSQSAGLIFLARKLSRASSVEHSKASP